MPRAIAAAACVFDLDPIERPAAIDCPRPLGTGHGRVIPLLNLELGILKRDALQGGEHRRRCEGLFHLVVVGIDGQLRCHAQIQLAAHPQHLLQLLHGNEGGILGPGHLARVLIVRVFRPVQGFEIVLVAPVDNRVGNGVRLRLLHPEGDATGQTG